MQNWLFAILLWNVCFDYSAKFAPQIVQLMVAMHDDPSHIHVWLI